MNSLVETKQERGISNLKIRKDILDFESMLMKMPNAIFGDSDLYPVKHSFADGIYTREMFIPKGVVMTGVIWNYEFPFYVVKGELIIVNEFDGRKTLKAPCSLISKPGTKRAIYAKEDSILITIHHNPDNCKDTDELMDRMTSDNYSEYVDFKNKIPQQIIPSNNCGLKALKKLSSIKSSSMRTLIDMAEDNGLKLYPYAIVDGEQMMSIPLPAIIHSENHFDYIDKKEDFNFNKEYTGYVLLTNKYNYKKIKNSELKNIIGETGAVIGLITTGVGLLGTIIGTASKDTTLCGKQCRAKCKDITGIFFSGRNKCKKECKDKCFNTTGEKPPPPKDNTVTYIIAGILIIAIIGLIWWGLKKK